MRFHPRIDRRRIDVMDLTKTAERKTRANVTLRATGSSPGAPTRKPLKSLDNLQVQGFQGFLIFRSFLKTW
jgi:hypothetical protein